MIEQFTNDAATTLAVTMNTAVTTTCVVTDASLFPTQGAFHIKIDGEILIVTGVSGNTLTVTRGEEGTTAATHSAGANVIHLLTKGSLEARIANRFITGPYDSKPSAGVKGRLFLPSDGLFIEYDDGASWHQYGPYNRLVAPPKDGWQWVNQGTATVTFLNDVMIVDDPDIQTTDAYGLRLLVRPILGNPATITMGFLINGGVYTSPTANVYFGLCARSSGGTDDGKFTTQLVTPNYDYTIWRKAQYEFNSPTDYEDYSMDSAHMGAFPQRLFWYRFVVDGNQKMAYFSADGVNWVLQSTQSLSTFCTPNQVGVCIDQRSNTQKLSMTVVHWEES